MAVCWLGWKICFLCLTPAQRAVRGESRCKHIVEPHFSPVNLLAKTVHSFVSSTISPQETNFHSTMDTAFMNSLVGDYLSSLGTKLAEKFRKETKSTPLPPGSPGLADMVKHFKETSPAKRKLNLPNGNTPAKKAKKVRIL